VGYFGRRTPQRLQSGSVHHVTTALVTQIAPKITVTACRISATVHRQTQTLRPVTIAITLTSCVVMILAVNCLGVFVITDHSVYWLPKVASETTHDVR
jgi:hypothetical protein